jgi:phenylalanyl-tRNA synthetase alpha chain
MLPPRPLNIPGSVWSRIGRNLHVKEAHPVGVVSNMIHDHFRLKGRSFISADLPPTPIVTTTQAFDDLLVPKNHVLRSASDTYYVGENHVLRPHATSHQRSVLQSLRKGQAEGAVWTCDVYRKDEVDRIHFPVFHQTDGVRVFDVDTPKEEVVNDLKESLLGLMEMLFDKAGRNLTYRWDETATFPFTDPSIEMEIKLESQWVECLGCGKIREEIDPNGWAFGIGIDRLAMLLFEIDDIRTLWSLDPRFTEQFEPGRITKFKPFSKYPATYRDTAFWEAREVDSKKFEFDIMQKAGPLGLENVQLIDSFVHPKNGKRSLCFRFTYRGIEKTLTSEECNEIHALVEHHVSDSLGGVIRT